MNLQVRSMICVPAFTRSFLPHGSLWVTSFTKLGDFHTNLPLTFTRFFWWTTLSCRTPRTLALYERALSVWRIICDLWAIDLQVVSNPPCGSRLARAHKWWSEGASILQDQWFWTTTCDEPSPLLPVHKRVIHELVERSLISLNVLPTAFSAKVNFLLLLLHQVFTKEDQAAPLYAPRLCSWAESRCWLYSEAHWRAASAKPRIALVANDLLDPW